jgi:hypothetical protein
MSLNLEALREEIPLYVESIGMQIFHGYSRLFDEAEIIEWDTRRLPEYQRFVDLAKKLGIGLIHFCPREFSTHRVDALIGDLEELELSREKRRALEKRLQEFRSYDGFTCAIELTFDYEGAIYAFEIETPWMKDLNEIEDEIGLFDRPLGSDDDGPIGGYFHRN